MHFNGLVADSILNDRLLFAPSPVGRGIGLNVVLFSDGLSLPEIKAGHGYSGGQAQSASQW